MSTDAGKKPPRRDSVVNSISNPEEVVEVVRGFKSALATLNSDHGFQSFAELVDRIPKLEAELLEKEKTLKLAHEANEHEKAAHNDQHMKSLRLYNQDVNQVQRAKDSLEQKNAELKTKISQKDAAIATFEAKENGLRESGRKVEERCKSLIGKMKAKDGEIAQFEQQLKGHTVKINNLSAELKKAQAEVLSKEASLREQTGRMMQLNKALQALQQKQEIVDGYAVQLEDINSEQLAQDFHKIWVSVTALVQKFVEEDLPDSALKRSWEKLDKAATFLTDQALPQTNSPIAKEVRVVKVLTILADAIHKHLLQPTYQAPGEGFALSKILYQLAIEEPKRERMLRGMLLAALEQDHLDEFDDDLIDETVGEVMRTQGVEDVIRPEHRNAFDNELRSILRDVQDIWSRVQYSPRVFQATFDAQSGITPAEFALKSSVPQQDDARAQDEEKDFVMLFPMLLLLGEENVPITTGTAVRKTIIAALMREERRMSRSGDLAAGPSRPRTKPRTLSLSSSARNGGVKGPFLPRAAAPNGPSNG